MFVVLLFPAFAEDLAIAAGNAPFIPGTEVALPIKAGLSLRWTLPPIDETIRKRVKRDTLRFGVDGKGQPWFGHDLKTLMNPGKGFLLIVSEPYEDFAWLEDGELVLHANNALGFLTKSDKLERADNGLPIAKFQPALTLPYPNFRLFPGQKNTLYLVGRNPKGKNYEVYILQPGEGAGSGVMRKLFSTPRKITSVAGDGDGVYIALDRMILKLPPNAREAKGVFLHPKNAITGLAFSKKSGLFYATDSGIGFIGPRGSFEFMKTPESQIRLRDNTLFVLLGKVLGVVRIEEVSTFKNVHLPSQKPSGSKSGSPAREKAKKTKKF